MRFKKHAGYQQTLFDAVRIWLWGSPSLVAAPSQGKVKASQMHHSNHDATRCLEHIISNLPRLNQDGWLCLSETRVYPGRNLNDVLIFFGDALLCHSLTCFGHKASYRCYGVWQELMLKEAAWTAKFIRRQREEEAEEWVLCGVGCLQWESDISRCDLCWSEGLHQEKAEKQRRSNWEQQAEEPRNEVLWPMTAF